MSDTQPVRFEQHLPDLIKNFMEIARVLDSHDLDRTVKHLVVTRASQINGCVNCLKMHLREAREHGETQDRLDRLVVWDHVSDFSEREKAALAWTEALTVLDRKTDYGPLRARLRQHFSDAQIAALTATIGLINFANRLQVSNH
ncbi:MULTISPECIES: carboxymuconolactone decarboxylase family protein [Nannocystis]|uniref:Carboxymuconolactone decarboxylase family protein n=1 Tax=Nannocystis radixulma TaxID=2995305 RepID=A0ABT5B5W5_9BACT|nr:MULTISPECIES: carboxymuconolactone decarboxylase family protein [Nannocystis]MCY1056197.1 carboxymuconolactone decarboxylase family protein [Nannocystis sp. SCPEA4]MDC0669055.1 carboxymuconolactone decarboxylase family protein [Nannocystis radixulma]